MHLTVVPLEDDTWPGEFTSPRVASPFTASWSSTLTLLHREVDLTANAGKTHTPAVLEVPFPESRIYRDGTGVHTDARNPRHPGVALSFDQPDVGPVRYAIDRYTSGWGSKYLPDWQSNVRAIALTLEALRAADRHGAVRRSEQYQGFAALGTGEATPLGAGMTRQEAASVLADAAGITVSAWDLTGDPDVLASIYRSAALQHHPDRGGNPEAFATITAARDVLAGS